MPRLLVVEQYPPLATVIAIALQRFGYEVERAGGMQRALQTEGRFDVAVLDLDLLDGSGLELAAALLSQQRALNIVFFTACREASLREQALDYGLVVDKAEGIGRLVASVHEASSGAAKVAGSPTLQALGRASGRSGTRRKID